MTLFFVKIYHSISLSINKIYKIYDNLNIYKTVFLKVKNKFHFKKYNFTKTAKVRKLYSSRIKFFMQLLYFLIFSNVFVF